MCYVKIKMLIKNWWDGKLIIHPYDEGGIPILPEIRRPLLVRWSIDTFEFVRREYKFVVATIIAITGVFIGFFHK